MVCLTSFISDNGPGVPEQIKDDIFDPFISSKSTGSGLGLTVVSKIMSDHGGLIEYLRSDSRTTFTLLRRCG